MLLHPRKRGRGTSGIRAAKHDFVHLALVMGEDKVQKDPDHGGDDERGLDDEIETLLEPSQIHIRSAVIQDLVEPLWLDDVDESDTESDGHDESVSSGELNHSEDTDTSHDDGAVQKDLHPAEDRGWHSREDGPEFRKETHEDEKHRGSPACATGLDYRSVSKRVSRPTDTQQEKGGGFKRLTAHPVKTMTPLFPACETMGPAVPKALIKLPKPSQRIPPWIRLLNSVPSTSTLDISAVARMSGMQLTP